METPTNSPEAHGQAQSVAQSPLVIAGVAISLGVLLVLVLVFTGALDSASTGKPKAGPEVAVVPGSTTKVEQVIGDYDAETKQPTLNATQTRYGILGSDLGYSLEHHGQLVF